MQSNFHQGPFLSWWTFPRCAILPSDKHDSRRHESLTRRRGHRRREHGSARGYSVGRRTEKVAARTVRLFTRTTARETRSIHETTSEVKMTRLVQDDIPLTKTTNTPNRRLSLASSSIHPQPKLLFPSRPALVMHPELAKRCCAF